MSEIGQSGTNLAMSGGEQAPTGRDNYSSDPEKIARWIAEIVLYDRESRTWYRKAKKIIRRYRDERSAAENSVARYNVLWSFVQTLQPACYARNPKPDIQRRFKDADPVGRVASDILERCVTYFADTDLFFGTARQTVLDYLLPGRGTIWVRYVPHFKDQQVQETDDVEEGEDTPSQQVVDYEEVVPDYVNVDDFGHNICRTWEECWCVWRKVYLTRKEQIERFGAEKGKLAPLDYKQKDDRDNVIDDGVGKSTIYELWDKNRKRAVWFHKDIPDALDVREDPLKLQNFFPCPKPLFTNLANDSLIPVSDYSEWQDQAIELDALTGRIASLTKSIKIAGVYDSSAQGVGRILSEGMENTLVPVDQWAMFAEKGGLKGVIDFLPLKDIVDAVTALYAAREQVKKDLYEITGIADIIRGNSDPNETAAAQQIKSNFATMRLGDKQRDVQRFMRETIRIMVDIISGHFSIETIKAISGVRLFTEAEKMIYSQPRLASPAGAGMPPPSSPAGMPGQQVGPTPLPKGITPDQLQQMLQDPSWEDIEALLHNQPMRCFRIDIETDSTIKADEQQQQTARMEFVKTIGGLIEQAENAPPAMAPFLGQVIMWVTRAFPVGKELEGALNTMIQQLEKQAQNPQPKPDPAMAKVQGEQQIAQSKLQGEMQLAQFKAQSDAQLEQQRVQAQQQKDASQAQQEIVTSQQENQLEAQREQQKLAMEERLAMAKIAAESDLALKVAHIKAAASIEVARITAKVDSGDEAEAREASGE